MGNGRLKTQADKSQLAVRLQTVNTNVEMANQISRNLQISADLKTIKESYKFQQI
jgi:hypothetical protein